MPFRNIPFVSFGQALSGTADAFQQERQRQMQRQQANLANIYRQEQMDMARQQFRDKKFRDDEAMIFNREKWGQQKALAEKEMEMKELQLGLKALELKGAGANGPFQGKGRWAQEANSYWRKLVESGLNPVAAERKTIDRLREIERSVLKIEDPITQQITYQAKPGTPLFKEPAPMKSYAPGAGRPSGVSTPGMGQDQQGEGQYYRPQFSGKPKEAIRPEQTTLEAVSEGTGYRGLFGRLMNVASGLSAGLIGEDEAYTQAKTTLETTRLQLRAFMEANKATLGEMKLIENKIEALQPGILKTPEVMRAELKSLDDYLMYLRERFVKDLNESNYIDISERRRLGARVTDIDRLRGLLFGVSEGQRAVFSTKRASKPARGRKAEFDEELNSKIEKMLMEADLGD